MTTATTTDAPPGGAHRAPPTGWHRLVARVWARLRSIPLSLVLGLGVLAAVDIWWIDRYRSGAPVGVDEAGYLTMAFADSMGLHYGGLDGLWHAVQSSKLQAPLAPLLTVPFHVFFGSSLADGFALSLVLALVLSVLTYALGRRLLSRRWAVLGALTVGAAPGVIQNEHDFLFALPLAVMFTAAVWSVARSDGLARTGWSLAAGIFIALACLSRTMGIGLVGAPLVAAGLQAVVLQPLRRRLLNLIALVASAVLLASLWYVNSFDTVFPYLKGEGPSFRTGGGPTKVPSTPVWRQGIHDLLLHDLYLPLGLGLLGCIVIGVVVLVDRRRARRAAGTSTSTPWLERVRAWVASTWFVPVVTLVLGSGVLLVAHQAVGQWLPLLPVLTVCALAGVSRARWSSVRWAAGGYLAVMVVFNTAMMSDVVSALSGRTLVTVPLIGPVPITDGGSDLDGQVYLAGEPVGSVSAPLPSVDRRWLPLSREVAGWIIDFSKAHQVAPVVAFASTDRLFNTNTVQLEGELGYEQSLPMAQLLPSVGGDSAAAYRAYLVNPMHGMPNFLISVNASPGEFRPEVTQRLAQQAAKSAGFIEVHRFGLPDGRQGRIWYRPPNPAK